ncbi:Hypothetical protein NG00_01698 [Corynebacterium camporealensis]|uniref:Uncharacterized protein n=1 Tax=Corynebacterium camporealensis TaxID=161896 RepID=A0A0F6TBE0_9CORY|nr:hypothetical protein UL81_09375 [Corynebacterium camporealensis]AVH88938.1 Hypothetical protein NG00_01698 [Corynebacterium camporealensis]
MKQRTALALALVTLPEVVILDEPFVGLDPVGVRGLLDILKQWSREKKVTMIVSSWSGLVIRTVPDHRSSSESFPQSLFSSSSTSD